MAKYFGTNGMRGRIDELTPELCMKAASAFGEWCKKYSDSSHSRGTSASPGLGKAARALPKSDAWRVPEKARILVARDMRLTGEMLENAVISGLLSSGCDVICLGLCSSPTAEFMLKHLKADGLIIVTASHNPPEWNALKFVDWDGVAVSRERGEEIEEIMKEGARLADWRNAGRSTQHAFAVREHISAILSLVDVKKLGARKLRVVLDCGNGTAALVAPQLFKELGCEVILLNEKIDGTFPGRSSEPTEANLQTLLAAVKQKKADLGVAWDGDSDRVVFVDEKGKWIVGDRGFALSALLALQRKKGSVVTTVATSNVVKDVCDKYGGKLIYTKVGAPYLSEAVLGHKAVSGGEEVGGIIWPELSLAKDGFMAAAKIAEAVCEKPLSSWLAELPEYFNSKCKIEAKPEQKAKVLAAVENEAKAKGLKVNNADGVRIDFPDSWVIIRASGTENYFRVFAEAKTSQKAKALMDEYKQLVEKLLK